MLPVASLLLAEDGIAMTANEAWSALSGLPVRDSLGYGWLQSIDPLDRIALRTLLLDAAAEGTDGAADMRIATPGAEQWSRWSWGSVPARQLIVSVVSLAGSSAPDKDSPVASDLASMVVQRLSGVSLLVQYTAALIDAPGRASLQNAADEIDSISRDVRTWVFPALEETLS